jgi:hypothetical protein
VFAWAMKIMGWWVWSFSNKDGGYEIHDYSNDALMWWLRRNDIRHMPFRMYLLQILIGTHTYSCLTLIGCMSTVLIESRWQRMESHQQS